MPKSAKSPAKPRPKPRPVKSPKKVTSAAFLDDEAEESDDGVLVEKPSSNLNQDQSEPEDDDERAYAGHSDYDYDDGFLNDGYECALNLAIDSPPSLTYRDPYEDVDPGSPSPKTPPLSPSKASKRITRKIIKDESRSPPPTQSKASLSKTSTGPSKSPSKSQVKTQSDPDDVIELESSDEDLTAMDATDSMFRKPGGVKPSALPPSLLTRGAANKLGITVPSVADVEQPRGRSGSDTASSHARSSGRATLDQQASSDPTPPATRVPLVLDPEMSSALAAWMDSYMAGRAADPQKPKMDAAQRRRVDHDALALNAALEATASGARALIAASAPTLTDEHIRSLSPDWDPPYSGELSPPVKSEKSKGKARKLSPTRAMRTAAGAGKTAAVAAGSSAKGKRKQESTSDNDGDGVVGNNSKAASSSSGSKRVKVEGEAPSGDVSTYMVKSERPLVKADGGSSEGSAPLTMAQYVRVAKGEEPSDVKVNTAQEDDVEEDVDTVFLEDIEVYKAYFNPKAPCGVFDIELQDETLRPHYIGLHPLPAGRRIVASYDPSRNSLEDIDYTTGGRVRFSFWFEHTPRMLAKNSMGAMLFVRASPNFINPARISPLELGCKVSAGSVTTHRLYVGDRIAICVSAVCCMESHVVAPKRVGAKSERMRKWFNGVFHDQDWERWEAILCLVFHERLMFGQFVDKAVSFQTMISPDPRNVPDAPVDRNTRGVPSAMFSTRSPNKKSPNKASSSSFSRKAPTVKTLLAYNDPIPVYDARKKVINFDADLDRLDDVFPLFPGEIPSGSFTIVGYTVSSYMATISGGSERLPHVGCNILWVIVCGTPSPS
ncbi:hypothetical protein DFH06DRAFT_1140640 [Mycena polygramma]|nr:hypothetical protein DFH06DRAFT_1140640 [Mycena polygramma]